MKSLSPFDLGLPVPSHEQILSIRGPTKLDIAGCHRVSPVSAYWTD